jgi:hypothetical protein
VTLQLASDRRPAGSAAFSWTAERAAFALFALIGVASLVILVVRPTNADTSWGLTLAEAVLSGQRLYVDILETNPPLTMALHLPASLVARFTGLSPEVAHHLVTLAALSACLAAAVDILRTTGRSRDVAGFVTAVAIFQLVPWLNTFGEREQFAVMALLPCVALWRRPGDTGPRPWRAILLAGIGGGLATAIKPVFALCLIVPAVHDLIASRRISRLLRPEYLIAAVLSGLYLVVAWLAYPIFFTTFSRVLADTYFQYRMGLWDLLAKPELGNLVLLTVVGWPQRHRSETPAWATAAILTAGGFLLAFVAQAKGYLNHEMAVLSLGYLGVAGLIAPMTLAALRQRDLAALPLFIRLAGAPLLGLLTLWLYAQEARAIPYRSMALVAEVAHAPEARTVMALSPDLDVGHPFARSAGLTYVGSTCSQWLAQTATERARAPGASPELRARMAGYAATDLARVAREVQTRRPDLILLDRASGDLFQSGASGRALQTVLAAYHPVARKHDVELLVRNGLDDRPRHRD